MCRHMLLGGLMLGLALLGAASVARTCGIDGVPSLSIDGRLVVRNAPLMSNAQVKTWTPFVARGVYPVNRTLRLAEDKAKVAEAMPPAVFRFPWLWKFGDGATARGTSVSHIYRRPGSYIVSVEAYFLAGKYSQWVLFDQVTLHTR